MKSPVVLCILDGVGINDDITHNAVALARMPFFNKLLEKYPHSKLNASGGAVGLPAGTMGNSEVGHITIGAGRIVNQFLHRFQLENWDQNVPLKTFINAVTERGGIVHLVGLMSDGRGHSDINDILDITKRVLNANLKVCIHFISDGRDTPPQSAQKYIDLIKSELSDAFASGAAIFGTLSGRYYAMDRDQNLERTELAFDAIARGVAAFTAPSIDIALENAYGRGETDEFIKPIVINKLPISDKDGILFANYRSDRARQILRSLITTGAVMCAFSQYGEGLDDMVPALLDDVKIENTLGDVLADAGKTQLRIAETEKYNHVTYFFDAERNIDFDGEEKILIPSPDVATFDLKPEMSAPEITDALLPRLGEFDVVVLNYANGDMIGHTGIESAAVAAMEVLDAQLARLVPAVLKLGGTVLITADHGNSEQMWDYKNNVPMTSHTTLPVPFITVIDGPDCVVHDGGLADIAPTILWLLNIKQPTEMTGKSLIEYSVKI